MRRGLQVLAVLSTLVCAAVALTATGKTPVVVFMCADSGDVSGAHELGFIYTLMRERRAIDIPFCQSAFVGRVTGKDGKEVDALAVTTGISYVSATACTVQLMRRTPYAPTSIVFVGTAGFSPFSGGLNPLDTESGCNPVGASVARNAIGTVCVTHGAYLMESGHCTETLTSNQCERPTCFRFLRGTAVNRIVTNASLAEAIRAASADVDFPPMPPLVAEGQRRWWAAHEAAEDKSNPAAPRLVRCAESTLNAIFVGAQRDFLCREYTGLVMTLPMSESVCVQAMEGFGFLKAMLAFPDVPVAIVRTASNYDMYPLRRAADGNWEQHIDYVSAEEHNAFVTASFHYSVKTATHVLANYFIGGEVNLDA